MIGLNILLICLGIAVLAAIWFTPRFIRAKSRLESRYVDQTSRFEALWDDISRISLRIDQIERRIAQITPIEEAMRQNAPESTDFDLPGTNMADFEPDSPIDPYDGRIPYMDTNWQSPAPDDETDPIDPDSDL